MQIALKASLSINSGRRELGGTIPIVFRKELNIELTPDILVLMMHHFIVNLEDGLMCRIYEYGSVNGVMTMTVSGQMNSSDPAYVASLKNNGWILDEEAAKRYSL